MTARTCPQDEDQLRRSSAGNRGGVPTLEGTAAVRMEPGTQPGATLRLRGEGMPRIRRRGRGDLKVVVDVMVPTRLTGEQRELLERFDAVSGEDTYRRQRGLLLRPSQGSIQVGFAVDAHPDHSHLRGLAVSRPATL